MTTSVPDELRAREREQDRKMRRRYWLGLYLPVGGVMLLLLIVVLLLVVSGSPLAFAETEAQTSILSTVFVLCLVLCPVALCSALLMALLVFSVFGLAWTHGVAKQGLRAGGRLSYRAKTKTADAGDALSRRSIAISALFARLDPLLNIFNRPVNKEGEDHE